MPDNQIAATNNTYQQLKYHNPEVCYHHIYIIGKWFFFIIPGAVYVETYFCVGLRLSSRRGGRLLIVASVRLRMQLVIITQLQYAGG
jgi:hypothetical protein